MHFLRLSSALVIVLAATACSSDDDSSTPQTQTNPNQPAASNGGSAGAVGAAGAAGSANVPAAGGGNGGSGSEATPGDIDLEQGGSTGSPGGTSNAQGDAGSTPPAPGDAGPVSGDTTMSFFVTSRGIGTGGNFGGLAGADAFCTTLAGAVSPALGAKTWRAYLSTSTVNARDRIGTGPWRNAAGVVIGNDVAQLHDQAAGGASEATYPLNNANTPLDETGAPLPANPVLHDILTGSNLDGTVSASGTCSDWTSATGTTRNGHSNRAGGGQNPSSWNSAHDTGCAEPAAGANFAAGTVSQGGGRGSIYCFAID